MPNLASEPYSGLRKKTFRLRAIESRMHARNVVERLRNPYPARENRNIGNEAHVAHKQITLSPGITTKHSQFSLIRSKPQNRVESGGFPSAIGTDDSENPAFFDAQI